MTSPQDSKNTSMPRRDFLRASAFAGVGSLVAAASKTQAAEVTSSGKTRYAIVGTGSRCRMFQDAIQNTYSEHSELVGFCDTNLGRLKYAQKRWQQKDDSYVPPIYLAEDFEKMVKEQKPDRIIVTTMDSTHHTYIVRSMELGMDVITEKPMTVDAEKCRQIIDTQKRTGRNCKVTFNYRYSPPRTQIKQLLMDGVIGDVLSVDFNWLLNTFHGADYFRRWHSHKKNSGGIMVHKSTHHFDLVNWWLSAIPTSVFATGKRDFYTPDMAQRFGLKSYHERCHTCPEAKECGFFFDLAGSQSLRELYLDNEKYDGYFRDRCVFRPDIDIEDTMNVLVRYDTGATLCYSVNAFNSWEGYQIAFNGTKGRIEHQIVESIYVNGTNTEQGGIKKGGVSTRVIPLRGAAEDIEVWSGTGSHGGGDRLLLDDIFLPEPPKDPYLRAADQRSGALSILTGVAANQCFVTGQEVTLRDLVPNIGYPTYPPMPTKGAPLPMPGKS